MKTSLPITDVLIPTLDNVDQLLQCVRSLLEARLYAPINIIIINNGKAPLEQFINNPHVKILNPGKNLGWEGGLALGLKESTTEFVCFLNDDTYIPRASGTWLRTIIRHMVLDKKVGASGPSSNVVMGSQNIWAAPTAGAFYAPFLIGFCMVLRRSALDEVGGVDETCPGGDDIDISIRLRKAGYMLLVRKDTFVYHHGFQTGNRVKGDHTVSGGWNSPQMTDKTNHWLIQKHGFLAWWKTLVRSDGDVIEYTDTEGDVVRKLVKGKVYDLGCGAAKVTPDAIGVDIYAKGEDIPTIGVSQADIQSDVTQELPFVDADTLVARHILEHVTDIAETLGYWKKALKPGGQLIVAVPDDTLVGSVPMNSEHVHAFTSKSLKNLMESLGWKTVSQQDSGNGISFISVFVCA